MLNETIFAQALIISRTLQPSIRNDKLIGLAVTSATRVKALPNVPTIAEAGVPDYKINAFHGFLAPAGTPPAIVAQLNADLNALLQQPDIRDTLARQDLNPVGGSPERFGEMVKRDLARWSRVVTAAKIKAD